MALQGEGVATLYRSADGNGPLHAPSPLVGQSGRRRATTRVQAFGADHAPTRCLLCGTRANATATPDVTPWLLWFLEQVTLTRDLANKTRADVLDQARFWVRHQETLINDRQRKVTNVLLDAGPEGIAGGMNTRTYVSLTRASRSTAYHELADLVAKRCLVVVGSRAQYMRFDGGQIVGTGCPRATISEREAKSDSTLAIVRCPRSQLRAFAARSHRTHSTIERAGHLQAWAASDKCGV